MDLLFDILSTTLTQLQKPTLAFLLGGMMLAALGSKLEIPDAVYKFIVIVLLLKIGKSAGISIRAADVLSVVLPALAGSIIGIIIVFLGTQTLMRFRGVAPLDGMATVGLFGAVSASTLAAAIALLDDGRYDYEGYIGAVYPFMDIAALVTAIVVARIRLMRRATDLVDTDTPHARTYSYRRTHGEMVRSILIDTFRSPAISALLLGLALGIFARPESVFESFYEPLFRGLLSLLMLLMGMEAWARLSEMRQVAHAYLIYGIAAPFAHGLIGFGAGLAIHHVTGFSAGGAVLLAVMAASSSDISGPPTMRGALPEANPAAYIGTSTGIGTPVAILSIPVFIALADRFIGF